MRITRVEYSETRTFGNYQNAKVGAVAEVPDGGDPFVAHEELARWVRGQLQARVDDHEGEREERYQVECKSAELEDIERKIAFARERWDKAKAFLETHGINTGRYDDPPF